jgi:hypothetical protein
LIAGIDFYRTLHEHVQIRGLKDVAMDVRHIPNCT